MNRIGLLMLGTLACSRPVPATRIADTAIAPAAPADSLVLTLPDSTEVRLVKGREGVADDGTRCDERSVVLVTGDRRVMVPLLYVRNAPRYDGGQIIATLSNKCVDVADYVIDPVTAYPTPRSGTR